MIDSYGDSSNAKVVVGTLSKKQKKLTKKKLKILASACLIILCVGIAGLIHHIVNGRGEVIDATKVRALVLANDCSAKAVQSVSKEKVNPQQLNASISLLSYRGSCLVQSGHYQRANTVFEQLKSYDAMKHDSGSVANDEEQIAADNYALAHPFIHQTTNGPPALSPDVAKKIDAFYGISQ